MTSDDIERLTPLLNRLRDGGFLETYAVASWPLSAKGEERSYEYAFRLNFRRLNEPVHITHPFTEDDLRIRESETYARQEHGPAIEAAFAVAKERVYKNLAMGYRQVVAGGEFTPPEVYTTKVSIEMGAARGNTQ